MYRYSWPNWFPYPKSMVRGTLVMSNFFINISAFFSSGQSDDSLLFLIFACFYQIPFFTLSHLLWGIALKLLHRNWYDKYRKGWFHLLEGINAFLVTVLTLPFMFALVMVYGVTLFSSYPHYTYNNYSDFDTFIGLVLGSILCLIASYYYHAGFLFWSWLNHKNKSLNQQYYENHDLQSLKGKMHQDKLERMKNKPWRKNKNKNKSYK